MDIHGNLRLTPPTRPLAALLFSLLMLPAISQATQMFPGQQFVTGLQPNSVALGDINRDGTLDMAVTNGSDYNVSILLGDGTANFAQAVNHDLGMSPGSVALGDLDNDGDLDMVVTIRSSTSANYARVLLGDGAGGFVQAADYVVGTNPRFLQLGDLDNDGLLDMVVANWGSDNVSVLLGAGAGGFAAAVNYATEIRPRSLALGDMNGDGVLDMAVANEGSGNLSVLLGDGTGGFAPVLYDKGPDKGIVITYPTGGLLPGSVALGDVNGDSTLDMVVTNHCS
ncbi:MAG: VCBS repeat-containing protein, partial [Gammaproteobacteria bacterium]|nr:VCBS repeat-containing protein [Gammaproteobacteria bacterium]